MGEGTKGRGRKGLGIGRGRGDWFWYRLIWIVPEKGPLNGCIQASRQEMKWVGMFFVKKVENRGVFFVKK